MKTRQKILSDIITFILPVRIDSEYRLNNLRAVLNFYRENPNFHFLIIEADSESRLLAADYDYENVEYHFVNDDNTIFHRTKYINQMLRIVKTELAAIWDVDVVCPESQIIEAAWLLLSNGQTMGYPFDGKLWCINASFSELFRKKLDLSILTDFPQNKYLMCGYYSVGGAFLVNVTLYKNVGWENENFLGWGPEDAERYKRVEILTGTKPFRVDGDLYHLFHPRGINSGSFNEDLAYSTKKEYCKVCSMTQDELHKYVESWNWTL